MAYGSEAFHRVAVSIALSLWVNKLISCEVGHGPCDGAAWQQHAVLCYRRSKYATFKNNPSSRRSRLLNVSALSPRYDEP